LTAATGLPAGSLYKAFKPNDGCDTQTVARGVHDLIVRLGLFHYNLVAHDVGAWVGFPYALMFADEIKRLALLDAGVPGVTLPDVLPVTPDRGWRTWHFPCPAIPDLPEALIEGRERAYLDWFPRRKAADPFSIGEDDLDEYVRIFTLRARCGRGWRFTEPSSAPPSKIVR
jgi:pimeloyl-ACP methyl ester carboxylesterase